MTGSEDRQLETGKLRQEVAEGFLYAHHRLKENARAELETASFLYALIELIAEKGLLSIEELDLRRQAVASRLVEKRAAQREGVVLQEPELDKYQFRDEAEIDCAGKLHLCKAACCRLPFALSKQDIREGIVRWDLGQPYMISQSPSGYCSHLGEAGHACTVRDARPVPCRAFDCRRDHSIWIDFDKGIINPAILDSAWPRNVPQGDSESVAA